MKKKLHTRLINQTQICHDSTYWSLCLLRSFLFLFFLFWIFCHTFTFLFNWTEQWKVCWKDGQVMKFNMLAMHWEKYCFSLAWKQQFRSNLNISFRQNSRTRRFKKLTNFAENLVRHWISARCLQKLVFQHQLFCSVVKFSRRFLRFYTIHPIELRIYESYICLKNHFSLCP